MRTINKRRHPTQAKKRRVLPDVVTANPITAAWDNASDEQQQEFVKLRRDEMREVEPDDGVREAPVPLAEEWWAWFFFGDEPPADDGIPNFLRRPS